MNLLCYLSLATCAQWLLSFSGLAQKPRNVKSRCISFWLGCWPLVDAPAPEASPKTSTGVSQDSDAKWIMMDTTFGFLLGCTLHHIVLWLVLEGQEGSWILTWRTIHKTQQARRNCWVGMASRCAASSCCRGMSCKHTETGFGFEGYKIPTSQ